MAKKGKKSKGLSIDLSNVKEGSGGKYNKRIKSGTYPAKIKTYEVTTSQNGDTMIVLTWVITDGKNKGWEGKDRLVLKESVAWKIFNLMKALGKKPKKKMTQLDPASWVDIDCFIDVGDDEYETNSGSTRLTSQIEGYIAEDEYSPEDEDEKPKKKSKDKGSKGKKSKNKKSKKDDDDELEEVDLDEEL
jgi:hypothetical protein